MKKSSYQIKTMLLISKITRSREQNSVFQQQQLQGGGGRGQPRVRHPRGGATAGDIRGPWKGVRHSGL